MIIFVWTSRDIWTPKFVKMNGAVGPYKNKLLNSRDNP